MLPPKQTDNSMSPADTVALTIAMATIGGTGPTRPTTKLPADTPTITLAVAPRRNPISRPMSVSSEIT